MEDQCANKSSERFNLKKIQNHWFLEAGGKLHRLSILNNANSVHMEENVIFADESMYHVIVNENGKLKIERIEDLCKSIGQEKVQPDNEQQSKENENECDCYSARDLQDSKDVSDYSDEFLEMGQEEYVSEEDESSTDKQLELGSEELVTEEETVVDMTILVTALYDFNARLDDEISFKAGDVFIISRRNLSNIWIKATHQGSGEIGFIPRRYVVTDFKKEYLKDSWWHDLNKEEAEKQLSAPNLGQGTFIIRTSHDKKSLALSVKELNIDAKTVKTQHYRIKCTEDGKFRLDRRLFDDVPALIQFYQKMSYNGLCCKLGEQLVRRIPDVPFRYLDSQTKLVTIRQNLCPDISTGGKLTIKRYRQSEMKIVFTEIDILKRLRHDNVINILAVLTKEKSFKIAIDMIAIGTLDNYLRQDMGKTIQLDQLIVVAIQIATGMTYLCSENIVHRDLRAKNILVGHGNKVKIAGFGLARRLQNGVYIRLDTDEGIAIRWTAPEVFNERKFTTHSDVWAYGVLLYEMITYGRIPYPDMTHTEIVCKIIDGYRMEKPDDAPMTCPQECYDIMLHCWDKVPTKRLTFFNIIVLLNNHNADTKKHRTSENGTEEERKTIDGTKTKTRAEKDTKDACVCM